MMDCPSISKEKHVIHHSLLVLGRLLAAYTFLELFLILLGSCILFNDMIHKISTPCFIKHLVMSTHQHSQVK